MADLEEKTRQQDEHIRYLDARIQNLTEWVDIKDKELEANNHWINKQDELHKHNGVLTLENKDLEKQVCHLKVEVHGLKNGKVIKASDRVKPAKEKVHDANAKMPVKLETTNQNIK